MAVVLEALPHLTELDLRISKSDGSKRGLGPMRVTSARSKAFRTPVMAVRTPIKKKAPNPITKPNKANDASRLTEEAPAPFTCTTVPWPKYILPSNCITPIVDEATTMVFSEGRPGLSPLYLKRVCIGRTIGNPEYEELPTEFVIGPMPGPPTPKKSKLLVGTSGKRACGICSRNYIRPQIAPRKWAPPLLRFPSTSSLPIWIRPTEWDDDSDDDDDYDDGYDDDYDDDYNHDDKDKISPTSAQGL